MSEESLIERLETVAERLNCELSLDFESTVREAIEAIGDLEAKLAEAAGMLDWIEENEPEIALLAGGIWQVHANGSGFGKTLREAIADAMGDG